MFREPATLSEVDNLIKDMETQLSAGYDEIKSMPIKYVPMKISHILMHAINRMLDTGTDILPYDLKISKSYSYP